MMLRNCLPAGETTGELTGAQVALQAAPASRGAGKKARHFQAAFGSGALRRALGGERREERRCGAEQWTVLHFSEKSHGGGAVFSFVRKTV